MHHALTSDAHHQVHSWRIPRQVERQLVIPRGQAAELVLGDESPVLRVRSHSNGRLGLECEDQREAACRGRPDDPEAASLDYRALAVFDAGGIGYVEPHVSVVSEGQATYSAYCI